MHVIWRCEWGAKIFVQCSGLNTELCMECKGLHTSSYPNTFEDMKLSTYLFPNCLEETCFVSESSCIEATLSKIVIPRLQIVAWRVDTLESQTHHIRPILLLRYYVLSANF